nr:AU022751 protein [Mus musculus]
MASSSSPERGLEALRDTDESEGEAPGPSGPRGRGGPSGAGSALRLRSLEAEMAAACVTSTAGEDLGTFSEPGSQHGDPEGGGGPDLELGHARPMMRSQRELGLTPKGGGKADQGGKGRKGGSGSPPHTKSSRKREQPNPNRSLMAQGAAGPPLPGARGSPAMPQPESSLSPRPDQSHHFDFPVGNLEAPGPTLRSSTSQGSGSTPVPEALRCAESSRAESDQSSPAGRELRQQASPRAPDDDDDGDGGPDPRGSGTPEGWVLRSGVVPFGRRSSASEVSPEEVRPEAQCTGWNLRPRPRSSASAVSPEARPKAQSAGRNLRPRPRSSASVVSPEARPKAQSAGRNLRSRPRSSASVVSPEARPEAQSAGRNLRPRATPRVPVAPSSTTRSSSDRGSSRAPRSRSRSRSCSTPRLGSDHQRSRKIKMRLDLQVDREPESEAEQEEQELESEPGPSSRPQASRSSSRFAVPGRSSLAAEDSPPRRPVRMRASSPSPPGRLYPLPKHYFEGVHSPSSSSSESSSVSSSHSPLNKAPDPGSSPPLSSLSGPNPFWLALIADLDNLDSSSPRVPGEEIEAAPHTREEEDKKCRG